MGKIKRTTILAVDDQRDVCQVHDILFSSKGYRVFTVQTSEQAFDIIKKIEIDVILSDIRRPGMDGFDFCKLIKTNEKTKNIPVIILSAYCSEEEIRKVYELEANFYTEKPVDLEEVHKKIEILLKDKPKLANGRVPIIIDHKILEVL